MACPGGTPIPFLDIIEETDLQNHQRSAHKGNFHFATQHLSFVSRMNVFRSNESSNLPQMFEKSRKKDQRKYYCSNDNEKREGKRQTDTKQLQLHR